MSDVWFFSVEAPFFNVKTKTLPAFTRGRVYCLLTLQSDYLFLPLLRYSLNVLVDLEGCPSL